MHKIKTVISALITATVLFQSSLIYADWFQTTVKAIHTRSNGNVAFRTDTGTPSSPCSVKDGWELHRSDNPNFKENVAILLSAYNTKSAINIQYAGIPCEPWGHGIVDEVMMGNFW